MKREREGRKEREIEKIETDKMVRKELKGGMEQVYLPSLRRRRE